MFVPSMAVYDFVDPEEIRWEGNFLRSIGTRCRSRLKLYPKEAKERFD